MLENARVHGPIEIAMQPFEDLRSEAQFLLPQLSGPTSPSSERKFTLASYSSSIKSVCRNTLG